VKETALLMNEACKRWLALGLGCMQLAWLFTAPGLLLCCLLPLLLALAAQVFILDALVNYQVQDSKDAEKIVERVLPRLQHVNSAVVLSAAKVRRAAAPANLLPCKVAAYA
jgi:hypothetical protein